MPEQKASAIPVVAAFDFDGTLTRQDTFLPFLYAICPSKFAFAARLSKLALFLPDFYSAEEGRHRFKARVVRLFFRGLSQQDVEAQAERFFQQKGLSIFFPQALERLQWHLEQHHRCYVISANIAPFLAVWAKRYPGLQILGTRTVCHDGIYTGDIQGYNCWGEEKVRRLQAELGAQKEVILYAYGDSRGDHALLARAHYAHFRPFH